MVLIDEIHIRMKHKEATRGTQAAPSSLLIKNVTARNLALFVA
jgi:hypothetical protein